MHYLLPAGILGSRTSLLIFSAMFITEVRVEVRILVKRVATVEELLLLI